ncbi:hypothetical protein MTO96_029963 [Rhipicephalus appendiculatus]
MPRPSRRGGFGGGGQDRVKGKRPSRREGVRVSETEEGKEEKVRRNDRLFPLLGARVLRALVLSFRFCPVVLVSSFSAAVRVIVEALVTPRTSVAALCRSKKHTKTAPRYYSPARLPRYRRGCRRRRLKVESATSHKSTRPVHSAS